MSENSVINLGSVSQPAGSRYGDKYLSIKHRLHIHLSPYVKLLGRRFRAFIPFLEYLAEAQSIYIDELLQIIISVMKLTLKNENKIPEASVNHSEVAQILQ